MRGTSGDAYGERDDYAVFTIGRAGLDSGRANGNVFNVGLLVALAACFAFWVLVAVAVNWSI